MTTQPKIFGSSKKRTTLPILAVLATLIAATGYFYFSGRLFSQTSNNAEVQTTIAQRGDLVLSASGSGTVIPQTDATFGFDNSGLVTQVYVKVGDQVEAGQVLAQLDATLAQMEYDEALQTLRELHSAREIATVQWEIATAKDAEFSAREWLEHLISPEVLEAEENLAIAQQKLTDAKAEASVNPSEAANQAVREKEQAVAYLTDKLTQAHEYYKDYYLPENFGEYENVGSRRHPRIVLVTYIDPDTGEELPEINAPSAADVTAARNDYIQAKETVSEGEVYLEALNTGVIPEGAIGEKLANLYETQQIVKNAKSALDGTQLISPISGTVTALDLSIGEQAGGSSVITISQLSQPYTLDVYLDETDWEMARMGNAVNVTFDLIPEQTYKGTVTLVYPELSPSFETSLVHILVRLDQNISQDLPTGAGATVEVVGGEARGVVLVPVEAIHETENGGYVVYVLQNGEKMEWVVEIGLQNGVYVEIKSGLERGETVVTE